MNDQPLPIVDNQSVFGSDYSQFTSDGLLPIWSFLVQAFPPTKMGKMVFTVFSYRIVKHSLAHIGDIHSPTQMMNTLDPIDSWEFPVYMWVPFMGEYRPVPPNVLRPFLPPESLDLLKVIDAGIIKIPAEHENNPLITIIATR